MLSEEADSTHSSIPHKRNLLPPGVSLLSLPSQENMNLPKTIHFLKLGVNYKLVRKSLCSSTLIGDFVLRQKERPWEHWATQSTGNHSGSEAHPKNKLDFTRFMYMILVNIPTNLKIQELFLS